MSSGDDIRVRLENLKCYMYNEIQHLISQNTEAPEIRDFVDTQKYKPTKHQRALKIERNFKKRCYAR
ncbi:MULTISPECIES: hypothetical protein [Eubacteriales]|uniref:Uncharacterized protein n=1 Tax=Ruminiclostridium papyrosolvens C7 TaxID=1330534 RepID=U4QZI0_9FIRM|nr:MULTISPECIES: hypothetical protein [Eubacteriales]AEY68059.1 hypothetical protein Clo1100_3948 [Clostridium sp. BNL1100]EPR09538.1 hypothetical protein L323_15975 [Ruminiclostridium papyrosolvens C7]